MNDLLQVTKRNLMATLMRHNCGLMTQDVNILYQKYQGEPIPFKKLGFPTLFGFLESVRDIVNIQVTESASFVSLNQDESYREVVNPICVTDRLHELRNKTLKSEDHRMQNSKLRSIPLELCQKIMALLSKFEKGFKLRDLPSEYERQFGEKIDPTTYGYRSVLELIASMTKTVVIKRNSTSDYVVKLRMSETIKDEIENPDDVTSSIAGALPSHFLSNLKAIIDEHPGGVPTCKLPRLFQERYDTVLDYRDFHCSSINELCSQLTSIMAVVSENVSWPMAYPVGSTAIPTLNYEKRVLKSTGLYKPNSTEVAFSNVQNRRNTTMIPSKVFLAIKSIILEFQSYLDDQTILRHYKNKTGEDLDVSKYGASNIAEFLSNPDFQFVRLTKKNDPFTDSTKYLISVLPGLGQCAGHISVAESLNENIFVGFERPIPVQDLPEDAQILDSYEVRMVEVYSLDDFYVHLKTFEADFMSLEKELNQFFNNLGNSTEYLIPPNCLLSSMFCAAKVDSKNNWCRVFVTKIISSVQCEVSLIDYGTAGRMESQNLRYLPVSFSRLPAQGVPVRLSGVIPLASEQHFSLQAIRAFISIMDDPKSNYFFATVMGKRSILATMQFSIKPFIGDGKIDVSEKLISMGLVRRDLAAAHNDDFKSLGIKEGKDFTHLVSKNIPEMLPLPALDSVMDCEPSIVTNEDQEKNCQSIQLIEDQTSRDEIEVPKINEVSLRTQQNPVEINQENLTGKDSPLLELVRLTDKNQIHIFNLSQEAFVCSSEISKLFPHWPGDLLGKMLSLRRQTFHKKVLSKDLNFNLFEQCILNSVEGIGIGDDVVDCISLYNLKDLPAILETCSASKDLISAANSLVQRFN